MMIIWFWSYFQLILIQFHLYLIEIFVSHLLCNFIHNLLANANLFHVFFLEPYQASTILGKVHDMFSSIKVNNEQE